MRLMRLGKLGTEVPVVVTADGLALDVRPIIHDFSPDFFAGRGIDKLRKAIAAGGLPVYKSDAERVGPPITRPAAIICVGQNYAAHAAESGDPPPETPIIFLKHPNTLCGPNDTVRIPPGAEKVDWEVELAVVIGQTARYVSSVEEAMACVAGYAIANDVSERDFQLKQSGGQWSKGKCCEGFQPLGPWLAVDEIPDPQALRMQSWVNGEPRQDSTTADMVFGVGQLIRHLSQFMVLSPGDVINTGTPQGVALSGRFPYLAAGDFMELQIEGLGRQRQELITA